MPAEAHIALDVIPRLASGQKNQLPSRRARLNPGTDMHRTLNSISWAHKGSSFDDNTLKWVVHTVLLVDLVKSARLREEDKNDVVQRWRKLVSFVEFHLLSRHRGCLYGQEHLGKTVTKAVDANRWGGLVDEEEVYRALSF